MGAPCLRMRLDEFHTWGGVLCASAVELAVQPIYVSVEQNILAGALHLLQSLQDDASLMELAMSRVVGESESEAESEAGRGVHRSTHHEAASTHGADTRVGSSAAEGAPVSAPAASAASDDASGGGDALMELYIKRLELASIKLVVTLQINDADPELQGIDAHQLSMLASLANLRDWAVALPGLRLTEVFEPPDAVASRAVRHYSVALLAAAYKLVLSLDGLGNVGGLVDDWKEGVRAVGEIRHGEIGDALAGVGGLVSGVAGGTASWGISFASSQLRSLSARTSALAFDVRYQLHRRQVQQQRPTGVLHGMQLGLEVLEDAFVSGVLGLLGAPRSASRAASAAASPEAGIVVSKGLGRAVVSLVAKVASGVLFFVSKTMEGINVTIVDVRGVLSAGEQRELRMLRVREPRELDRRPLLLPYPPPPRTIAARNEERTGARSRANGDASSF